MTDFVNASSATALTVVDMQTQLAPFLHQAYLTGVRVPDLYSDDLILELTVEIYGEALDTRPDERLNASEDDGLHFTLEEAEALLNEENDDAPVEPLVFPTQRWDVLARGVSARQFELGVDVHPQVNMDARTLLDAQFPHVTLMFSAAPASVHALLASLFEGHDRARWGEFGRYGLGGNLAFGAGVFAQGPKPLLDVYAGVLERHGMRPSFMGGSAEHLPPVPHACLTLDDEGEFFVLAQEFQFIRRAELDNQGAAHEQV